MPQSMPSAAGLQGARKAVQETFPHKHQAHGLHVGLMRSMSSSVRSRATRRPAGEALVLASDGSIVPMDEAETSHASPSKGAREQREVTSTAAHLDSTKSAHDNMKPRLIRKAASQRHEIEHHQSVASAAMLAAPASLVAPVAVAAPALLAAAPVPPAAAPVPAAVAAPTPAAVGASTQASTALLVLGCVAFVFAVVLFAAVYLLNTEQLSWLKNKLLFQQSDANNANVENPTSSDGGPPVVVSKQRGGRPGMGHTLSVPDVSFDGCHSEHFNWNPEVPDESEESEEVVQQPPLLAREVSRRDMKKDAILSGPLWKLSSRIVRDLPIESFQQGHPIPAGVADWASWRVRYFNVRVPDDGAVDLSYVSEKADMTLVPMRLHPLKIGAKLAMELPSLRMQGDAQTRSATMAGLVQYKLSIAKNHSLTNAGELPEELHLLLVSGTNPDDADSKEQYHILGARSREKRLEWISQIEASANRDL